MFFFNHHRKKNPQQDHATQENSHSLPFFLNRASSSAHKKIRGYVVSDIGLVRPNNEDNYVLGSHMNIDSVDHSEHSILFSEQCSGWQIAAVFDGMGGGDVGELASRYAAEIFHNAFHDSSVPLAKEELDNRMRKAFLDANNKVICLQQEYQVFGTTGTVVCSNSEVFKIYHLGDSRAYLFRNNDLLQLTTDQTLAQIKIEVGLYLADDPAAALDKHKLTDFIGRDKTKQNIRPVESHWIPIMPNDKILICSDGLYDMCANEEILLHLQQAKTIPDAVAGLVRCAREHGGNDNITCIIMAL